MAEEVSQNIGDQLTLKLYGLGLQCGMSENSTHIETELHTQNFRGLCYDTI